MNLEYKDFSDLTWSEFAIKVLLGAALMFCIFFTFAAIYIVSVGYLLADFYYYAFTVNLWIPVSYHTWFIIATIPMLNLLFVVLALWALVLKFSIIYFVTVIIPMMYNFLVDWFMNIVINLQSNGSQYTDTANATLQHLNNLKP